MIILDVIWNRALLCFSAGMSFCHSSILISQFYFYPQLYFIDSILQIFVYAFIAAVTAMLVNARKDPFYNTGITVKHIAAGLTLRKSNIAASFREHYRHM